MTKNWEKMGLRPHLSKNERVPRSYKEVEKVLKDVKACKGNLKTVLSNSKLHGQVFKKVYSLATNVLKYRHILDRIIQETKLLEKETFLREDLAEILIYELVFGKGLPGESRPVIIIKQYEDFIRKAYENTIKDDNFTVKGLQSLPKYVRINTLLTTVSEVLKNLRKAGYREIYYGETTLEKDYLDLVRNLETGNFIIDYHFKDLLVFASSENLTTWPLYQKNQVYIQDKSSYIPVYALDPKPGNVVIDSCAAPGMKTIHITAAMENNGKIYAYEKNQNRFQILKDMLGRANIEICEAECEDFYLVNANDPKFRDLECILVDPSCSGSGMVNRMDTVTDTKDSKNKLRLQKLAGFQILLLKHALTFPSVKRVVYSTCSISEEENEYVVHEVLNHFCHVFKLVSVMPNWLVRGSDNYEFGKLCLRANPEETLTNGFFVAMFERLDYDEQLNISRPISDKLSKKNRKRKQNFEGRYSSSNNMGLIVSEEQDNPQFCGEQENSPFSLSKKKKKECTFDNYAENKDEGVLLENDELKKKKHINEADNKFESSFNFLENDPNISTVNSQKKKERKSKKLETEDGENNDVEVLYINNANNTKNADFSNSNLQRNPIYSDFSNKNKTKKKHKKEVSICEEIEYDERKDSTEQTILESELGIKTKKHKHKKKHSKEKAEMHEEYIAENNLPQHEMTSDLEEPPSRKKHKKYSKKETVDSSYVISQVSSTIHKKSLCCNEEESIFISYHYKKIKNSIFENTEVMESYVENLNKEGLDTEDTYLKKKHKKKCKDKKTKEE